MLFVKARMSVRSEKRQLVWEELKKLEEMGLGKRIVVSAARDKFQLALGHPASEHLTPRPEADGFIRSDENSLLFRYAVHGFEQLLGFPAGKFVSNKGVELRWTTLNMAEISRLFEVVRERFLGLTPVEQAREFILDRVQRPALKSELPSETKNKVRNSNIWLSKFDRVGDILAYLRRFKLDSGDATYAAMKAHGLQTFEDILPSFEERFSPWANEYTRATDYVIGEEYSAYQILIFANNYDTRAGGMFVISAGDKPAFVVIKATLEGGMYANEWIEPGLCLKYYLKSIKGVFKEEFKPNAAILNNAGIPVLTFVRDTADGEFTYFGFFQYEGIVREENGAKYFILKRQSQMVQGLVSSVYAQKELERAIKQSVASDRDKRLTRLAAAPKKPGVVKTVSISYDRNPDVVAEVLYRANGTCEICRSPAPFLKRTDRTPYLEVHHIVRLADGGDDTVENAVGICPNCHRNSHFGILEEVTDN